MPPARYLLKIDPPECPHVVENEHYFIRLAARSRLPVVRAEVVYDATHRSRMLVERFDRTSAANGTTLRLAVEARLKRWASIPQISTR